MAILNALDVADMVKGTLYDLGRLKFQQIAQELQGYEVMSKWLRGDKVVFDDGIGIQRNLMDQVDADAADHVGLFEEDSTNVVDHLKQLQVPWRHARTRWAYEYREYLMNAGKSMVLNIVKPRRVSAMLRMAAILEERAFDSPSASTDTQYPLGIPHYVTVDEAGNPSGGNSGGAFNGYAPDGWTTVAGINPTSVATWRNWNDQYAAVTKADLIKKMREAHYRIGFKSPVAVPDYRRSLENTYRIYTQYPVVATMEEVGEAQNENLGRDIASMDGMITFRKHPIVPIPQLEGNILPGQTADLEEVYMINHNTFYPVVLRGDFMRETGPKEKGNAHNVFETFVDLTYNFLCIDRRRNAVIHKTAA